MDGGGFGYPFSGTFAGPSHGSGGGLEPGPGPGSSSGSSSVGFGYGSTWTEPGPGSNDRSDWVGPIGIDPGGHSGFEPAPRTGLGVGMIPGPRMNLGGTGGWDYDYEDYLKLEELKRVGGVGLMTGQEMEGRWIGSASDEHGAGMNGIGGGYASSSIGIGMDIS